MMTNPGKYLAAYAAIGVVFLGGTVLGFQNLGGADTKSAFTGGAITNPADESTPPAWYLTTPFTPPTIGAQTTSPARTTTAVPTAVPPVRATGQGSVIVAPTGYRDDLPYGTCAASATQSIPVVTVNSFGNAVLLSKACVSPQDIPTLRAERRANVTGIYAFVCRASESVYATAADGSPADCSVTWWTTETRFPVAMLSKEQGCIPPDNAIPDMGTILNRGCLRIR